MVNLGGTLVPGGAFLCGSAVVAVFCKRPKSQGVRAITEQLARIRKSKIRVVIVLRTIRAAMAITAYCRGLTKDTPLQMVTEVLRAAAEIKSNAVKDLWGALVNSAPDMERFQCACDQLLNAFFNLNTRVATRKFANLEQYLMQNFDLDSLRAEEVIVHLQRILRQDRPQRPPLHPLRKNTVLRRF